MSVFMRAVVREWGDPPSEEAAASVASQSPFRLQSPNRSWSDFEAIDATGETVLAADVWTGHAAREELAELLMSRYDDSVAAANAIINYLERRPNVLTQVDTVGWYDGPELVLREPE